MSILSRRLEFEVLKCDPQSVTRSTNDPPCKSSEELDEWFEDVEVEVWVTN